MSEFDEPIVPSSDSFWEIGQYKTTIKRVDDGHKLCTELMTLVTERCEIEKAYSKNLKHWMKKWNESVSKGSEYGTTQAAWHGLLEEAERVSEVHNEVKNDLLTDVHTTIKQWQKENFHKNMMGVIKESKELEDNYRRAQKPWAKRLSKVIKCKKEYHTSSKSEKSLKLQQANAKGDSSVTPEQVKKVTEKVDKAERETDLAREKYNAAISDLNAYNAKYIEEMTEVFDQCQEHEEKRLKFFKDTMFAMHTCLNICAKERFPMIYQNLHATINNADPTKDLKWWSNTYGVGMPMSWPAFEEYSPELKPISAKTKFKAGADAITLVNIAGPKYTSNASDHSSEINYKDQNQTNAKNEPAVVSATTNKVMRQPSYDPKLNPFGDDQHEVIDGPKGNVVIEGSNENVVIEGPKENVVIEGPNENVVIEGPGENAAAVNVNSQNPFGDDWDTHYDMVDDGTAGVPVRALYDYKSVEDDELNLKAGEIFHKLSDEDEQGWCKGRREGVIGLYPANYADPV